MKLLIFAGTLGALVQVSCMQSSITSSYTRAYRPEKISQAKGLYTHQFEVNTMRGNVHFVHDGIRMLPEHKSGKYIIKLINHGHEFDVTMNKMFYSRDPWTNVRKGEILQFEINPPGTGFQASNQARGPAAKGWHEPINATIIFIGLPGGLQSDRLIESYGEGL